MILRLFARLCLLSCLTLSACGDLPEPFLGNPGATARRLSQPPAILAVPPGPDTLLTDQGSQELADQLAIALQASEVPAVARAPRASEWQLVTTAVRDGAVVKPVFSVRDPKGKEAGSTEGEPVPLADWAGASPAVIQKVAVDGAVRVGSVLTSIRIAHDKADPNSLYNRGAKVVVADVTGAPGDGDTVLTKQMRQRLAVLGPVVLPSAAGADFIVEGKVAVVPLPKRLQRVEIQWVVKTASGDERGRVVQLNEIPAGTLDRYWGDVAVVVAAEASNGVNDVLLRQAGHDPNAERKPAPG